jgi:hypothetical protein
MRRPVLYLAGMLLATGASLALAGPASAAVADGKWHKHHKCHHQFWNNGFNGYNGYYGGQGDFTNSGVYTNYAPTEMNGLNVPILSGVGQGASGLSLGGLL